MDFEVTATRKRPKTLGEMVGQDFVVATLSNALANDQVAHAYLFSGPRGTGKTSTARILARSLNCESGPTAAPCGTCASCVEISKGSSPDVIEIDGASNTSVNDVREIKDEVLYAPQSSRKKIYIIDEVHMLSNSAFNALLKTIEEPPPYIIFIFATTEVHKVPATIRSRCQQFRFRLFSPELIRDKLVEAAGEMGRDFEPDALFWIAREAGGSMRDAYTLFDQVMSFSEAKITLAGIREKMGLVGLESTADLLDAAAAGNRKRALEILDEVLQSGTAVEQVLVELADFLRNLTLLSYGIEKESLLGVSPDRFPAGPRQAWDGRKLEAAAEDAFSLFRDIRYSMNPRYELELFIGRLCSLTDRVDPADVLERIGTLRHELVSGEWSESGASAPEIKKKTPEPGAADRGMNASSSRDDEAEKFFSTFRSGGRAPAASPTSTREDTGEPDCAVPVDIGIGARPGDQPGEGPPEEEDFVSAPEPVAAPAAVTPVSDTPVSPVPVNPTTEPPAGTAVSPTGSPVSRDPVDPALRQELLLVQMKRSNLTLAAALEKARAWQWNGNALMLTFDSSYEATLVKNEAETLRRIAVEAGIGPFSVDTRTEKNEEAAGGTESSRVALVRQVFRGQVMKG